ncbi:hypothetical protein B0H17DRAFT_1150935 [Mycena rosella]|uniref:Uncharacterized protein n=1 Tax=Mycena rosella TaxID=1033263 RepID=A0AAD7BP38_MYCRO|nr:hypothetical protein B0H17DRAFT_1150935 [Mycena rosella]
MQAKSHGQFVALVQGCKPIAEGSIVVPHGGVLNAVMDDQAHTKEIKIWPSRSLIRISKVLVPGALHSIHGQTMEWIFTHGAHAVVTTSQLHTRNETAPLSSGSLRIFAVPAPLTPSAEDDTDFSTTYISSNTNTINFEHWNGGMNDPDEDSDDSDDDSESEDDIYSQRLVFGEVGHHLFIRFSIDEQLLEFRCNAGS